MITHDPTEIVLGKPELCNLGHPCTGCQDQIVGMKDGICGRCLRDYQYNTETDTDQLVGYLLDGNYYCQDCASWWNDAIIKIYRINIGPYSQICTCCRKVIVKGVIPANLFPCKYENSRKVIGA